MLSTSFRKISSLRHFFLAFTDYKVRKVDTRDALGFGSGPNWQPITNTGNANTGYNYYAQGAGYYCSAPIQLPFDVRFVNTQLTTANQFVVGSDGSVCFGPSVPQDGYGDWATYGHMDFEYVYGLNNPSNYEYAYDDGFGGYSNTYFQLMPGPAGYCFDYVSYEANPCSHSYQVLGSAPNRELVIQTDNLHSFYYSRDGGVYGSLQVVVYEAGVSHFQFNYGPTQFESLLNIFSSGSRTVNGFTWPGSWSYNYTYNYGSYIYCFDYTGICGMSSSPSDNIRIDWNGNGWDASQQFIYEYNRAYNGAYLNGSSSYTKLSTDGTSYTENNPFPEHPDTAAMLPQSSISLELCEPPAIASQPSGETLCEGSPLTLSVGATGDGLHYQWQKNSSDISGATDATYSVASVMPSDAGMYDVVVNGNCGTQTSDPVAVIVNMPPAIASQTGDETVGVGGSLTLAVNATGTGLTYQWQKDGSDISGATDASYTIASVASTDAGTYDCVLTGTCGTLTSNNAAITVSNRASNCNASGPQIAVTVSPNAIGNDGAMHTITASPNITGSCYPLTVALVSITSDETLGSGDVQNASYGTDDRSFDVLGSIPSGHTRTYTALYSVTDGSGLISSTSATIRVTEGSPKEIGGNGPNTLGEQTPILAVHPNPATDAAWISVSDLPEGLPAKVVVLNILGEPVATLYDGTPDANQGLYLTLDCSKLPNGTYYAQIWNMTGVRAAKLVVQH